MRTIMLIFVGMLETINIDTHTEWMKIYCGLMRYGLSLFEPSGKMDGVGAECLLELRTHFEEREAYGRAEFVNGILTEYRIRWPR
jgi:hypothetical protein